MGLLLNSPTGGFWSLSQGLVYYSDKLISSIIFTGSQNNHFERLRGVLYADGTENYYEDGGNLGAFSYNLYSESETNAFLGFIAGIAGGELLGGLEIGNLVNGLFAKSGTETIQYTKSSLSLGREMHAGYKLAEHAPELGRFKEFGKILGIRPDFVDFSTKTIYELKPFNPRAMQQGVLQLNKYQSIFEQRFGGVWNTILDTY